MFCLSAVAVSGCASARHIVVEPGRGGVVSISSNTGANRAEAMKLMKEACPGGFEIYREEEVPVGQRVRSDTTTRRSRSDYLTTKEDITVRTRFEWRISYNCLP